MAAAAPAGHRVVRGRLAAVGQPRHPAQRDANRRIRPRGAATADDAHRNAAARAAAREVNRILCVDVCRLHGLINDLLILLAPCVPTTAVTASRGSEPRKLGSASGEWGLAWAGRQTRAVTHCSVTPLPI